MDCYGAWFTNWQRAFLAERDRCARKVDMRSCVAARYTARIKALDRRPRTLQRR